MDLTEIRKNYDFLRRWTEDGELYVELSSGEIHVCAVCDCDLCAVLLEEED